MIIEKPPAEVGGFFMLCFRGRLTKIAPLFYLVLRIYAVLEGRHQSHHFSRSRVLPDTDLAPAFSSL